MPAAQEPNAEIQFVVRRVFDGIAPERSAALSALWDKYSPQFHLVAETKRNGTFTMESGAYCRIHFDVRALRLFWLAAFLAWEGYSQVHNHATKRAADCSRLDHLHRTIDRILTVSDPWAVQMPDGVPEPGLLPDATAPPEERLPAELACFAIGWALLHEIRHLKHQQDGTGAKLQDPPERHHDEELSCDAFATTFLLERIAEFAASEETDVRKVTVKRELGIYFALFAMTLVGPSVWTASTTHPSMQTRIDNVVMLMGGTGEGTSDAIARAAFAALQNKYPKAPTPFSTDHAQDGRDGR